MFPFKKTLRAFEIGFVAVTVTILVFGTAVAEESQAPALENSVTNLESAQTVAIPSDQPDAITREYVKGYIADTERIVVSPANWSADDWLKTVFVVGATTGIYFADGDIRDFAQKKQSATGNKFATVGNVLGNPLYTVPSLGLFYLYGHFAEDSKARRTSLLAVESLAISGVFTVAIKQATQRSRPFTGEAPTAWDGPGLKNINSSFPSVHTQSAFSIASVVAEEYGNYYYVPAIAYGLATLTGLARVYDNKHWASDVVFGAAIGYFVGKTVVRYHTDQSNNSLKLIPTVSQQGFGVTAEYRF